MRPTKKQERELAEYREFVVQTEKLRPNFMSRTGSNRTDPAPSKVQVLKPPIGRAFPVSNKVPSFAGSTEVRTQLTYSGTKMLGIGTLHKSNAVPVFSDTEAVEIAQMRRN